MANFNNIDDTDFYPALPAFDEFGAYLFPSQTPANEEANVFADDWSVGEQPGHMAGLSSNLWPEATFDSVALGAHTYGYGQPPLPNQYWPAMVPFPQSYGSDIVGRDDSFASTMGSEFSALASTPSSAPFNYWGDNQNGSSTSMSHTDMRTSHHPSTGPIRTGMMPEWQFQPYGTPRVHPNGHVNAEAGSSTLMPPLVPHLALPTAGPSGGSPETSADAENKQTETDEDAAPTTRRPRGTGIKRNGRIRTSKDARRLCVWAQGWKSLRRLPSHEKSLGIALEVISTIREPVYPEPQLLTGKGVRTKEGSKGPDDEHNRRKGTRELNQELSKYYQLPGKKAVWGSPELLLKVLSDVEGLPKP